MFRKSILALALALSSAFFFLRQPAAQEMVAVVDDVLLPPELYVEITAPTPAIASALMADSLTPCQRTLKALRSGNEQYYFAMHQFCASVQQVSERCFHFPTPEFLHRWPCSMSEWAMGACEWVRTPGVWCKNSMNDIVNPWRPTIEARDGKAKTELPARKKGG